MDKLNQYQTVSTKELQEVNGGSFTVIGLVGGAKLGASIAAKYGIAKSSTVPAAMKTLGSLGIAADGATAAAVIRWLRS